MSSKVWNDAVCQIIELAEDAEPSSLDRVSLFKTDAQMNADGWQAVSPIISRIYLAACAVLCIVFFCWLAAATGMLK